MYCLMNKFLDQAGVDVILFNISWGGGKKVDSNKLYFWKSSTLITANFMSTPAWILVTKIERKKSY